MNGANIPVSTYDRFVSVLDATLRVQYLTPAGISQEDGPYLVFLHEGLGCVEMWKDFPAALCSATNLNGIAYDRQGYGQSSPFTRPRQPDYLHIEAKDYLPGLLQGLDISETILVGHSDGGTIALLYAGMYPSHVRGVICEAAHVFVEPETVQGIVQARRQYQSTDWPQRLAKYHGDKTDAVFYAWADTWLSEAFSTWNIEPELQAVQCPVLVMQGVDDAFGTARQVESMVNNTSGPAWPYWVPECGHIPHLEAKTTVLQAMQEFIQPFI